MSGGRESCGQWFGFSSAAENVAKSGSNVGGEKAVNEGICRRVQMCQVLYEAADDLVVEYFKDLQKVHDNVRAPA